METPVQGARARVEALNEELLHRAPQDILDAALRRYPRDRIALSFSGAEDVALVDMAVRLRPDLRVFTLDTGRLPPETYEFLDRVRSHYGIPIEVYTPDTGAVQRLVSDKGFFSFYRDGHEECCGLRKVEPLRRALRTVDAWITGQRRDQSPGTRSGIPVVQIDPTFQDIRPDLVKFNPLALWSSAQVFAYLIDHRVPVNPLHQPLVNAGGDYRRLVAPAYVSLGCQPCTTLLLPGEHERAARWRWEALTKKECGLHLGNTE
jgi:phosphoadenosine phosphosulfate reductase